MEKKSKPKNLIRSFFAIELSDLYREATAQLISNLKQQTDANKVKWVRPEKMHLTLRFLGDVSEEDIAKISDLVKIELQALAFFQLEFKRLLLFPASRPKVIALGFSLSAPLAELIKAIEQAVNKLGFIPEDRAYLPHVTLGRIQSRVHFELESLNIKIPATQDVEEIVLFKSELTPAGSIYTALEKFQLNPTPLLR